MGQLLLPFLEMEQITTIGAKGEFLVCIPSLQKLPPSQLQQWGNFSTNCAFWDRGRKVANCKNDGGIVLENGAKGENPKSRQLGAICKMNSTIIEKQLFPNISSEQAPRIFQIEA